MDLLVQCLLTAGAWLFAIASTIALVRMLLA
jgi:hypothetical protein